MARWWRDLSVSKKLYAVVGVLVLLVTTELFTLFFAMDVLSSVRSFVGGEGLWSKGQKNAVYSLHRYATSGNPKFYQDFLKALEIPHGDHAARVELSQPNPNEKAVINGFVQGGNDPHDVPGIVRLIRRFYWVPYIKKALVIWAEADDSIVEMELAGLKLQKAMLSHSGLGSPAIEIALSDVDRINDRLTALEVEFSNILGQGSRWLEHLLMVVLICVVLSVESTGLLVTVSVNRSLSRSLKELMSTAQEVGKGNFAVRAPVHSQDELGQLAGSINKMASDLEQSVGARRHAESASQSKSQFLANMSHEIRTPLGVILGLSEILRDPALTRPEHLRYVDTIERTGKNLIRIINDILDLSKVEADRLEIENSKFALTDLFSEIQTMLMVEAERGNNRLTVETLGQIPPMIMSDRTRLRQILVNLVNNSLKYTRNGEVKLSGFLQGRQLVFDIEDTGAGISNEDQQALFEAFSRIEDARSRETEGTGLGLMIAKRLAQALGGDVQLLTSRVGHGSTFRVDIRLSEFNHSKSESQTESQAEIQMAAEADQGFGDEELLINDLTGRRVLVVEDSEDNQLLVKLLLTKKGMVVEFASNGREAVNQAPDGEYDFVLMDMQMPVMDGYAATQELRSLGFRPPIVALTAHAMKEDRQRCLDAGCDEYLTKPINSQVLFAVMSRLEGVST